MEKILKEINARIKEIAQSEEINTQELTELINIRDRLKGYNTTSIAQVQGFNTGNNIVTPAMTPVMTNPRFGIHQNNSILDTVTDVANMVLKNQAKQFEIRNINDLINYHGFISVLKSSDDETTNNERSKIKNDIEDLIMKEFKNIINEKKNAEKDKILDTTAEVKNTEKSIQPLEVQT